MCTAIAHSHAAAADVSSLTISVLCRLIAVLWDTATYHDNSGENCDADYNHFKDKWCLEMRVLMLSSQISEFNSLKCGAKGDADSEARSHWPMYLDIIEHLLYLNCIGEVIHQNRKEVVALRLLLWRKISTTMPLFFLPLIDLALTAFDDEGINPLPGLTQIQVLWCSRSLRINIFLGTKIPMKSGLICAPTSEI